MSSSSVRSFTSRPVHDGEPTTDTQESAKPSLLIIGGSGLAGSIIVPGLAQDFRVRVLDPFPPRFDAPMEYVPGSSTSWSDLSAAFEDVDLFVYLAMGPKDPAVWEEPELAALQFDMAVKGVYLTMRAAREAGVEHGVYASSMGVFEHFGNDAGPIRDAPPNATSFYGLAKRLGEDVIAAAIARTPGMSVIALRLCFVMSDEEWLATESPLEITTGTSGSDLVEAFRAALRRRPDGFEAIAIAGDRDERYVDMSVARELLGWEPRVAHPRA
jgi:nucleoside-diphosphate-sugar epimerase